MEQEWSLKTCVALCLGGFVIAAAFVPLPWALFLLCFSLLLQVDRALALLACWAIAKTPKAFHWSIELIRVRPNWSLRRSCWSEITVINWTWHNPPGFEDDERSYILEIDRLCVRLQLFSILGALGNRRAIQVKMVCVEGVRFNTQRNEEALLNLWEALHLDDGANEATIVHGAHQVGGLDHPHMVKQLHSEAAEQAGRKTPRDHRLRRQDTQLGDPLRRPRWGVPVRFKIEQVCVIGAKLWLFDLLTTDRRWRLVEPKDTRMEVAALAFPWETLSKRDPRRDGHGDGVKGVYLGELVWVLIAQLLPRVLESSPRNLLKTALFAVGFGAWDASVIMGAKAFELALDAKYCLTNVMPCIPTTLPRQPSLSRCFVHVHLICGRGLVREQDQYCNVLVRLELKNPQTPQGQVADVALAPLRMWTKSPWWDQRFCLGPATSTSSLVRIRCFHRKARHMMSTKCDGLLGQVLVPLSQILAESRRTKDGAMVRWFPLDAASMMVPRHGHLKLGFRLSGQAAMNPRSHSGNCYDDNVLMQMEKFHKGMTSTQHKLISNKIEKAFAHIKGHGSYLGKKAFPHIKGHGSHLSQTPSPSSVIDSKFANITGSGGYNPHDVKADATWQKCTAINWTKVAGEPTTEGKLNLPSIHMMLEELELQDHCACPGDWCNDDTCKAVFAAIEVFIELCASEFDPVFANFSVTTWGYYPSWVNGTVHGLDYTDEMPVKVTLKHPKGVCGYAVCDLLRTILTQSANQMMTGTCSYVASLAALSKKAPARAIKIATRLFWLGEITPGLGPCPGILAQQPGLIPFKTQMGWKPSFYAGGSATCHGNSADCGHASGMPQQNIGLTFEWSQTLISKWMAINWGYCSNDTVRAGMTWPGQSKAAAAEATKNQGGWYNSMVWECQSLFDLSDTGSSSCRLVINPLTCALGVDMAPLCKEKWSKELAFPVMNEVFQWDIMSIRSEAYEKGIVSEEGQEAYVLPALKAKYADEQYAKILEYIHLLENLADTYQTNWLRLNDLAGPPYPSFTMHELNETCNAHINMLIIDATVLQVAFSNPEIIYQLKLQHLPAFGNYGLPDKSYGCNHAVFLSECDHEANEYTIWTWGTSVKLTREILLGYPTTQRGYKTAPDTYVPAWNTGALCAAVIADKVNVD